MHTILTDTQAPKEFLKAKEILNTSSIVSDHLFENLKSI